MLITTVPKLSDAGATVNCPLTLVPVSATVCGLPVALSAMDMFAENEPVVLGAKVTLMVHEPLGWMVTSTQLSASVKPVGIVIAEIVTLDGELAGTEAVTG